MMAYIKQEPQELKQEPILKQEPQELKQEPIIKQEDKEEYIVQEEQEGQAGAAHVKPEEVSLAWLSSFPQHALPGAAADLSDLMPGVLGPQLSVKVVGVSFNDRQRHVCKLQVGQLLVIHRMFDNPYDDAAVAVSTLEGDMLGHVARDINFLFQAGVYACTVQSMGPAYGTYPPLVGFSVSLCCNGKPMIADPSIGVIFREGV